jgi:hypothetical protein
MENFEFEWDEEKASRNLKKHRVSFDEAATISMILEYPRFLTLIIRKLRNVMFPLANPSSCVY